MTEYIKDIEFGKLKQFERMAVLPVFLANEGHVEYITLKEAMEKNLLEITEINESGSVPELKVINYAEMPVLILDGEELVGAKQNRIVNTSILLKENSETIIPVSCVEQGRWTYRSQKFHDSDRMASHHIRNVKSASVKRNVESSGHYSSDQGAVWNEVHKLQNRMEINSPTDAMSDVYEATDKDLDDYIKAVPLAENQKGILVFIDNEIVGFDAISSGTAYKDIHKKLIKSYALDAMVSGDKKTKEDVNADIAQDFLTEIMKSEKSKNKSVGYGFDYRFASDSYIGSSLVCMDEVVHASFFKSFDIEDTGGMTRYRQRANLRL